MWHFIFNYSSRISWSSIAQLEITCCCVAKVGVVLVVLGRPYRTHSIPYVDNQFVNTISSSTPAEAFVQCLHSPPNDV